MRRVLVLLPLLVAALAGGCGTADGSAEPSRAATRSAPALPERAPTPSPSPVEGGLVSAVPRPTPATPTGSSSAAGATGTSGKAGSASLVGDTRNQVVWAPLSDPSAVRSEGSVGSTKAWSTSKVLVVAAYLDTVVDGDPSRIPSTERGWIRAALTASDGDAVVAVRERIPGSPGGAITAVLRSIGDTSTVAPDRSQGAMSWSPREQVRFMAALAAGRVVSPEASAFLLEQMRPIPQHRWGLGTIGASAFKGGWLTPSSETRQMGIVDGYAVAIITVGQGPAVVQTDGDAAHVEQMNRLAAILATRLR
ncbi:serine hydrolase [Phycicoccus jejuensis]|uniref:serine hydrolase n=1 Tax=Phycicoccus jejuensis TaxID=367299 RepID=UPI0004C2C4B5|nr:serine hydrolase [Phycicoccus jejuensis]